MTERRLFKQYDQSGAADAQRWTYDGTVWVPFGTYEYAESEAEQTTTSGSFVQALRLTTASLPAGDYEIGYQCAVRNTAISTHTEVQVQVDDDPDDLDMALSPHRWGTRDVSSNQRNAVNGARRMNLTAGVHNIDLDFRPEAGTSSIFNARLYVRDVASTVVGGAIPADFKYQLKQVLPEGATGDQEVWWTGAQFAPAKYFQHEESLGRSTTTSQTFQQKVRLSTAAGMPAGKYLLYWHLTWDRESNSGDAGFRVQLDDTTDLQTWELEPRDPSTNQTNIISGFREQTLIAGVRNFDLDFREVSNSETVGIKDAWLTLVQVGV